MFVSSTSSLGHESILIPFYGSETETFENLKNKSLLLLPEKDNLVKSQFLKKDLFSLCSANSNLISFGSFKTINS